MKHISVPAALDLVVDGVGKESKRIREAGSEALRDGKLDPAMKAIDYAKKLEAFVKKVRALGDEWSVLLAEMAGETPEVKEIVQQPQPQKPRKTGFTRNVGTVAPKTNFTVTLPDGTTIADTKAKVVFAKTIEKLGVESVAKLNLTQGGEPLVSKDKAAFKKQPSQIHPMDGGWYVKTHSSTGQKIKWLKIIAKGLKVKLQIKPSK